MLWRLRNNRPALSWGWGPILPEAPPGWEGAFQGREGAGCQRSLSSWPWWGGLCDLGVPSHPGRGWTLTFPGLAGATSCPTPGSQPLACAQRRVPGLAEPKACAHGADASATTSPDPDLGDCHIASSTGLLCGLGRGTALGGDGGCSGTEQGWMRCPGHSRAALPASCSGWHGGTVQSGWALATGRQRQGLAGRQSAARHLPCVSGDRELSVPKGTVSSGC